MKIYTFPDRTVVRYLAVGDINQQLIRLSDAFVAMPQDKKQVLAHIEFHRDLKFTDEEVAFLQMAAKALSEPPEGAELIMTITKHDTGEVGFKLSLKRKENNNE